MSKEMFSYVKLKDVADVEISSVDKKCKENEIEISLCNFVDVYYNWAITERKTDSFMKATAKQSEIDRFALKKGQVAITKDSETKNDIGVAAYIADDLDNVILGYHCALITPNENKLSGKYLNAFFHTKFVQKYFELNATGSGQRFTLSLDAIKDMPIYLPSLFKQKEIAEIFSNIDRKIELNEAINDNLQNQMCLLYEQLMSKAISKQIQGNFVCAKELTEVITGKEDANFSAPDGLYKFFTCSNTSLHCNEYAFDSSSVLIAGNGDFNVKHYSGKFNAYQRTYVLTPPKKYYALMYLASLYRINLFKSSSSGSIVKFITKGDVENIPLFIPDDTACLNELNKLVRLQEQNSLEIETLAHLRDFLLPMLMNGQATIDN